ncbi:MAG: rhodanese-like domain-containing protein [archaeon]
MFPLEMVAKDAVAFLHDPSWVWLDVREDEEFSFGHIPSIKHIPMSALTPRDFDSYSKDQKFMIVCRSGSRSGRVAHSLRSMGFVNACNFSGGMFAYNSLAEKPIPVLMH